MRVRGCGRSWWAAVVAGLVVALVVTPLGPAANAGPGDPGELWVNVNSDSTYDVIEGATVTLYDDAGTEVDTAVTDELGDAGFVGLASGTYYVSAAADGYVEEFYDDSPDLAGAWSLTVDEFFSDNAYMYLAAEPQVSGTVTGPGGTPLESAEVTVYQYDADYDYWDWATSAYTDEDGSYELGGLDDGSYRLGFQANGYIEEYFDDQPDVESGDDVTVSAGGAMVVADAELDLAKHITGTVTDGSGPVEGVQVTAQQQIEDFGDVYWDDVAYADTDASGDYSLDVDPGEYRVRFESGAHLPEWWDNAYVAADADLVSVTTGDVTGIDAALDEGGSISGTVTAFGGGALEDVWVSAYQWNAADDYWEQVGSASSATDGRYSIDNLLGGTYRVGFEDFGDHLPEYYDDAEQVEDATDVAVTVGSDTGGVDATLDKAGIIQGTVSGPGVTAANLEVALYQRDRYSESGWSESFDYPEITGTGYRFTGLQPGTYRLRASAPGLAPEFYEDAYEVAGADDLVAARNTTTTADVTLAAAPTVSGTVTDLAGALNNATVEVQRKTSGPEGSFWDDYATDYTDTGGNYSVPVAPGTYRLRFSQSDHVTEWHDGSATPSRSTRLVVGATDVDVDAALDRLGRIAGTVTGPSGAVSGATVGIWRYDTSFGGDAFRRVRTTTTNGTGGYTVAGLQPGNYRVGFNAAGMESEFNLDEADVEYADDVAVELNETDTVDAALDASTRQLSGTVTGQTGTGPVPLEDASVIVQRRVVRLDDVVSWRQVADVATDAAGAWSVPVLDGDYRLQFSAEDHVVEWYDDAAASEDATVVTVAGGSQAGIDALLARGGTITGTVTDAGTSDPIADAEVYASTADGSQDTWAYTDADGGFTLDGLMPGEWVVSYSADGYVEEYFDDQPSFDTADPITVAADSSHSADAALTPATEVSGTVTGPGGAPVGSAWVDVHRVLPGGGVDYYFDSTVSNSDGTWSVLLPPGSYLVQFEGSYSDDGYLDQWYDGAASEDAATPVVVGSTHVTGIDAQLQPGGALAGTVTGPTGAPEPDAYVSVYPASATQEWQTVWEGFVDEDGTYLATGLPAGGYKVRFETFEGSLQPEYHADKADLASADPVAVSLGGTTTVDAQLASYPRQIAGTVTDAQGRGLDDVEVSLYRQDGAAWTWERDVATDADGDYDVPVSPGTYRLYFADYDNRLFEWWDDAETEDAATSVLVAGSDRTGIDAELADGGVVTGTVTYPQQVTGWSSTVTLYDATTGEWTAAAGVNAHQNRYRIEDLPTGSYRAEFSRTGGFDTAEAQFWSNRPEHQGQGTQTFSVTEGSTAPGIGATLVDGGILTGVVEDGAGNPLAGCRVSAYTPAGSLVLRESRNTGGDGSFRVRGLTTGSYRLRVIGGECGFTTFYYDGAGQMTTNAANAVGVPATRAATGAVPQPLVVPTGGSIANTGLPTISDTTPEVGQTLTATTGSWSQTGLTFAYQWLADGTPIAGATGASYVAAAGDAGKALSVRVTASKPDYADGVATSAPTADVVSTDPPVTNTGLPTINDTTPEVGQTLTATTGAWSQTAGVSYAYRWTADGVDIPGATSQSFQVTADQLGTVLRVQVTASKTDFTSGTATSTPTSAVVLPTITNTSAPTIDDTTPELGQLLTAGEGTWNRSGLTFEYQWFRGGTAIGGATGNSYTPVAADVGQQLRVRVTAKKTDHQDGVAQSALTSPVVDPEAVIDNTALPTVSDTTPQVGQEVTAGDGTWSPSGLTFAYQWFRGATAIGGATAKGYTPVAADLGQQLRVRVTASKAGYTDGAAQSAQTSPVAAGTFTSTGPPTVSTTTPQVGQEVTAGDGTWSQGGLAFAYQWFRGATAIGGATAKGYTPVAADLGQQLRVRVTASRAGYTDTQAESAQTSPVAAGVITARKPGVKGKPKVGKVLKVKLWSSNPAAVKVRYQWLRNGKVIKRAKKAAYKVTKKDRHKKISVRVTRTTAGYEKLVLVSRTKKIK